MTPVTVGLKNIEETFIGDMGVKEIYVGDTPIYQRQGGYFYLELNTKE